MANSEIVYQVSDTHHWKTLFPKKNQLLGSHNLNPGEELIARIQTVKTSKITNTNGQEEIVPVMTFDGVPPMVLNITNARTIGALYGSNYDDWVGKSVQIYVAHGVEAFGETVDALRIRGVIPGDEDELKQYDDALRACTDMESLKAAFMSIPKHLRARLAAVKNEMKGKINASK